MTAGTQAEYESGAGLTKHTPHTPYPSYGVYFVNFFLENWPRYNGTALYVQFHLSTLIANVFSAFQGISSSKRLPLLGVLRPFWILTNKKQMCTSETSSTNANTYISFFVTFGHLKWSKWQAICLHGSGNGLAFTWANTVGCHYKAVNHLQNPHDRHPIARPWGRDMWCLLWF